MKAAFQHSPFDTWKKTSEALFFVDVDYSLQDTILCDALTLYSGLKSVHWCRDGWCQHSKQKSRHHIQREILPCKSLVVHDLLPILSLRDLISIRFKHSPIQPRIHQIPSHRYLIAMKIYFSISDLITKPNSQGFKRNHQRNHYESCKNGGEERGLWAVEGRVSDQRFSRLLVQLHEDHIAE